MADITYNISAGDVITVPIDTTLSIAGQAADAKATGDALALKADISSIGTAIKVNNQTADAGGNILLSADEITMTDASTQTIAAKFEAVIARTSDDILYETGGADSIKDKLDALSTGKAPVSAGVPVGGDAGQVLGKRSATDRDLRWMTPATINDNGTTADVTWSAQKIGLISDSVTAVSGSLTTHTTNTVAHVTSNERNIWNAKSNSAVYRVSVPVTGWSQTAPYTTTIAVTGMMATDDGFLFDVDLGSLTTVTDIKNAKEAFACVDRVDSGAGSVTLTCSESVPANAFTMIIRVVR